MINLIPLPYRIGIAVLIALSLIGAFYAYRGGLIRKGVKQCEVDYEMMQKEVFTLAQTELIENRINHDETRTRIIRQKSNSIAGNAVITAFNELRKKPYYSE